MINAITNKTTEILLPYPIRYFLKLSLYICIAKVSDELKGPPPVIMYKISKPFSELITESAMTTTVDGTSRGMIIYHIRCHVVAPSLALLSIISDGMAVSPAR